MFDWRRAPPPLSSSLLLPLPPPPHTFNFSIPSKKFYGVPKSSRGGATYLPQKPSTPETVFNLKTNYELLGKKLKFKFFYLKTASDKVITKDVLCRTRRALQYSLLVQLASTSKKSYSKIKICLQNFKLYFLNSFKLKV